MEMRQKTNTSQWLVLVEFLEQHPEMLTKKFEGANGKQHCFELWNEVTNQLNSMGFGEKTAKKWQEVILKYIH